MIGAAGWGKTTAVAAWSRNRPTAWLRYEDHEADADRLLASLLDAVEPHTSQPGSSSGTEPSNTAPAGAFVATICAWLRRTLSKDLILVIDDLHTLEPDSEVARVVESLCLQAPRQLRLVLLSRREPPFSLQRLRGRGLVTEIHAPDLAFDVADVEMLLRRTVGRDPPGLSRRVWEHTGGWATAVHCAV
ncbi:MAG: hypothetical protein ACRDS1_09915, partial [Pseudonocardiaceae bacterium]